MLFDIKARGRALEFLILHSSSLPHIRLFAGARGWRAAPAICSNAGALIIITHTIRRIQERPNGPLERRGLAMPARLMISKIYVGNICRLLGKAGRLQGLYTIQVYISHIYQYGHEERAQVEVTSRRRCSTGRAAYATARAVVNTHTIRRGRSISGDAKLDALR